MPFVSAVAITSTPLIDAELGDGTPETYGSGETILVRLTFGAAVAVTGTPADEDQAGAELRREVGGVRQLALERRR